MIQKFYLGNLKEMENYKSEKNESVNSEDILNQYQFVNDFR